MGTPPSLGGRDAVHGTARTRSRKTGQQAGFFLAFPGRRANILGRLRGILLRLLWNRKQFHSLLIMSPKTRYLEVLASRGTFGRE